MLHDSPIVRDSQVLAAALAGLVRLQSVSMSYSLELLHALPCLPQLRRVTLVMPPLTKQLRRPELRMIDARLLTAQIELEKRCVWTKVSLNTDGTILLRGAQEVAKANTLAPVTLGLFGWCHCGR